MTINIEFGWWLIPAIITAISFIIAFWRSDKSYAHGLSALGQAMSNAFLYLFALVASLISWLVWSLIT